MTTPQQTPAPSISAAIRPEIIRTPISPFDPLDPLTKWVDQHESPLSRSRGLSSMLTAPLETVLRPPISSPSSPAQALSAIHPSSPRAISDRSGAEEPLPCSPTPLGREEDRQLGFISRLPGSPRPPAALRRSISRVSSLPPPTPSQHGDIDTHDYGASVPSSPSITEQALEPHPHAPIDEDITPPSSYSRPPLSDREPEIPDEEINDIVTPVVKSARDCEQNTRPKSIKGTKVKSRRTAGYVNKGLSAESKGADAEGEADDEEAEEPSRKKPRMEIPDPPGNTPLPSVAIATTRRPLFPESVNPVKIPPGPTPLTQASTSGFRVNCSGPRSAWSSLLTFRNVFDEPVTIQLPFHHPEQQDWFESGLKILHNTQPLYLSQHPTIQGSSCIRLMSKRDFSKKWRDHMADFPRQHIVVTGPDCAEYGFNAEGLDTVLPHTQTDLPAATFSDQSTLSGQSDMFLASALAMSTRDFQEKSRNGQMISYTGPKVDGPAPHHSLSTEIYANRIYLSISDDDLYHPEYFRWGHASTTGSYRTWDRSQCAGYFESVVCGSRLFFVSRPKDDSKDPSRFLYDPAALRTSDPNSLVSNHWDVEAVIVPAGSKIISLAPSISHGAFFIPCAMIERVIIGLYQNWATTGVTSGLHFAIENATRAIICLWRAHFIDLLTPKTQHIPDLETPEGIRQLLCICCYRELVNICWSDTYATKDFSRNLSVNKRKSFIEGRQMARDLMAWFLSDFKFSPSDGSHLVMVDVYDRYIAAVLKALLHQAKDDGNGNIPHGLIEAYARLTFPEADHHFWDAFGKVAPKYDGWLEGTITRRDPEEDRGDVEECTGFTREDRIWESLVKPEW
ncbi:hypothetical protein BDN72DRAFT_864641 [Pluteus cervinus]|uniref:Uncharacterized protein n=1 Tax=Pluteus cervinus TaxID=181527 RepID=A0ACD3A2Y8_9AGAR|nr:hypothetical protein BDN72DRAFT_864641 [Pluteus cervinus]